MERLVGFRRIGVCVCADKIPGHFYGNLTVLIYTCFRAEVFQACVLDIEHLFD